jgi:hypothetical protein
VLWTVFSTARRTASDLPGRFAASARCLGLRAFPPCVRRACAPADFFFDF